MVGYAMELRTHSARTTKDIDLTLHDGTRLSKDPKEQREQVRALLQEAAAMRMNDYFEFLIGEAREDLEGAPGGGAGIRSKCKWMDGYLRLSTWTSVSEMRCSNLWTL
jgi:hypothetical protein